MRSGTTIELGESRSYRPHGLYPNDLKVKVKVKVFMVKSAFFYGIKVTLTPSVRRTTLW